MSTTTLPPIVCYPEVCKLVCESLTLCDLLEIREAWGGQKLTLPERQQIGLIRELAAQVGKPRETEPA